MKSIKQVRLGDVAQFIRGINFKPDDVVPVGTDGTVACMRTKNVQEMLDCGDVWGVSEGFVRRPEQMLKKGDILVSSANSWNLVGKCCWIPDLPWRTTFGGFVTTLRADSKQTDPRFLYWWFSSDRTQALLRSFGQKTTNISNLNIDRCLNLSIPFPSLPDQRRIAAILDQTEALRVKRREALAQLDSLTQSIFIEMFGDPATNPKGWEVAQLETVATKITDGEHQTPKRTEFGIKLLSARNIRDGYLDFGDVDFIDAEEHQKIRKRCNPERGDILISCSGSIGRVAIVETDEPLGLVRSAALVKPNPQKILSKYLETFLRTPHMNRMMISKAHSSSQANLFQGPIRALPIALPPIALQQEFIEKSVALQTLRNLHKTANAELENLFASLQHRAFRGEL